MMRTAEMRTARAGELLARAGDAVDSVSLLCDGFVVATAASHHGKETALQVFGAGEMWGCVPILLGQDMETNVRAVTDVRLAMISAKIFFNALGESPRACRAFATHVARHFSRLARLRLLGVERSDRRICGILLWLRESSGLRVPVTQALLAMIAGTTEETVSRALSPLKRQGFVAYTRSAIDIVDPERLRRILEG